MTYHEYMTQQLRNRRFETRLDAATDDLIAQAATQVGQTRSAFVVRSARAAAEQVVASQSKPTKAEALAIILDGLDETELAACPLLRGLRS